MASNSQIFSSSASDPSGATDYDICLSFHDDTRYKFTSHLYSALDRCGLKTFMNLDKQTVHDSKFHVVVFSKKYASSPPCLDQLVEIMNYHKSKQRRVIPIFYNIETSAAFQNVTSISEKDFRRDDKTPLDADRMANWRAALMGVRNMSGYRASSKRFQADIISDVVHKVLSEINPKVLNITKYPVGLDSRVNQIIVLLSSDTKRGAIKFGIYGMAGVGKTTLAKSLYNQLLHGSFEGSCFLENFREVLETERGLVCLQEKLLNDVLNCKNIGIDNADQGFELIRARICSRKVVIVIDDVDNAISLDFIIGPFASGSVVIITTRDEEVLDQAEVEPMYRYMVNVLNDADSLTLFTKHAFGGATPNDNLMMLSRDILRHAGGLPLALEVFGSYLSTLQPSQIELEEFFQDSIKIDPNDNFEKRLMISFDALKLVDPMLQDIFLDIACFFIGWKKEDAVKIMETYYSYVDNNIENLKRRCLLTINNRNELEIHDLLRDMGRKIVRNNSPDECGKHSRLWVSKDIYNLLKTFKGTEAVECIIPSNFYYQDAPKGVISFNTETFKRMTNLRFLYLNSVDVIGSFEQIFEDLRWLRWDCCPLKCLPFEFRPPKLVALLLRNSKLRTVWDPNMFFQTLKTLDMSYSLDLVTTPDFSKLPSLETLILEGCKSLEEVHVSIGSVRRLVSFNLWGCVNLKSLPDSICYLRALQSLNIGSCSRLEALPIHLGNIESLTELNVQGLTVLELPDSVRHLSKAVELNLNDDEFLGTPSFSASVLPHTLYDVFLSFHGNDTRGKDTSGKEPRYNFINRLYNALDRHGVRTYMDDPELRIGELHSDAMLHAILSSKTYIVVLSDNYATSRWCLDELVDILNCHKRDGRLIIPVFYYKIDASIVRYQTRSYEKAFKKHQINVHNEKVNKWRHTLTEVASISGYHISDQKRSEFDIIDEIVEVILKANTKTSYVAKNPIGLDSYVKDITTLLGSGTEHGVIKIGIYGIDGVGKTTLARTLYNQHLQGSFFKYSSFLANVREISNTENGLITLQQQLINDVLKSKNIVKVHNVDQGTKLIRTRICSSKILVVIDDIDSFKQYEYLAGPFASGSVVIITTRHKEILDKIQVDGRYQYMLNPLNDAESLALFSQHAFGAKAKSNNIGMDFAKVILPLAGGLRVALEVLGSYLSTQSEKEWIAYNEKLQSHPDTTTLQVLEISYDALKLVNPFLQDIFLDIACFFIGWKKREAVKIMETFYTSVNQNIEILIERCLLTINYRDEFEMHDLLLVMGREIARNDSPDDPGKHSRLWKSEDIYYMLKNHKGTEAVKGIFSSNLKYHNALEGVSFSSEAFESIINLRFLYLENVNLTGSFVNTLQDLRWLCWYKCPLKYFPSTFHPQKLVNLELPHSKIRTMSELSMVFGNLKTLNMKYSQDLTTTMDFTILPCLETLNLEGCESLEELHRSIGSLEKLISLNLCGCVKLKSLPDTLCNLRALKGINIGGCSSLEALPAELGNITSLNKLDADGLSILTLPNSIGRLHNLVKLRLSYNKNLLTLPQTICDLRALKVLDVGGCRKLEALPTELGNMESLEELNVNALNVWRLTDSVGCLSKLVKLHLKYSKNLETLPVTLSNLSSLESLDLRYCGNLVCIENFPPNLKWIRADGCTSMQRLQDLSHLKRLEILALTDCSGLKEIQGLKELISIRILCLGGCSSSLLADTLTKHFLQVLSGYRQEIKLYIPAAEFPDWISHSSDWIEKSSNAGSTMFIDLLPNLSQNFSAMILCFKHRGVDSYGEATYAVKKTTSGFIWSGSFDNNYGEAQMIIVPSSIFSVKDGDIKIEVTADAEMYGILLVYGLPGPKTFLGYIVH